MKLMDIDQESLEIRDQAYNASIEMPSAEFRKLLGDLVSFSDVVRICAVEGELRFEAVSGESGGNIVTYADGEDIEDEMDSDDEDEEEAKKKTKNNNETKKDGASISITVTEPVNSSFSTKYLSQFSNAAKLSKRVRISLSDRSPIVVEYKVGDNSSLAYYLSPRIESSDAVRF